MDSIFLFIPFILFPLVIGGLGFLYFGGKKLSQYEVDHVPLFTEQAGGRFDSFNLSIPLVRHTIYEDFVVISYGRSNYRLPFSSLKEVQIKRHSFSIGVSYQHTITDLSDTCIIWSTSPEVVREILVAKGVLVSK